MGRPRKFENGEIVQGTMPRVGAKPKYVVVDYENVEDERRYKVIPLDFRKRRRGDAVWVYSWVLESTGQHSGTASIRTFRANEALVERGCSCQCCIHEAYDTQEWTDHGRWRDPEQLASERPNAWQGSLDD